MSQPQKPGQPQKPAFCPYIYTDGVKLYLEFDAMVLDFVFTEEGLNKALKHIPRVDHQPGYVSGRSNFVNGVKPKRPPVKIARKTKATRETAALRGKFKGADDIVRLMREGKLK